jgi:hypothetical protein
MENIEQLQQTIEQLKNEVNNLKNLVANPTPISADAYQPLFGNFSPTNHFLQLPLSKIIDLYRDCPEILETYAQRAAIDKQHFSLDNPNSDQPLTFNANGNGNFWVIQLENEGCYLFPRPSDFKRMNRLEYLDKIFVSQRDKNNHSDEFDLEKPAKLQVLKIHASWRLEESGIIVYGNAPLHYQWQQELTTIRQHYQDFSQHLVNFFNTAESWQQTLTQKYGNLISLAVNTSMPIAYAIYRGPILVPCQIFGGNNPRVLPGWDQGVPWDSSIYAKFHSKRDKDLLRTPNDHPLLPNQIYLKEINQETNHTWAIAKSYDEATTILQKLVGNWGSLEISSGQPRDDREW